MNKVGVLHGHAASQWAMPTYEKLKDFNILPTLIGTRSSLAHIEKTDCDIVKLWRMRDFYDFYKIPSTVAYVNQRLTDRYHFPNISGYDNYLIGLEKIIERCDLIHTLEVYHPFSYQAVKTKKPVVVTVYENIPFLHEEFPLSKYKKYVIDNASSFIAITNRAKKALELEGVQNDLISVIPMGIDTKKFCPMNKNKELLEKYNLPNNSINILFIGRMVWEKGIYDLIYSFSEILKKFSNIYLLIAGNGNSKNSIIKLSKKIGIFKNVRFLGFHKYSEIPQIHNLADIFCLPSIPIKGWQEQFGFVLIEAMACCKPVISTRSGSISEVIHDGITGILVPPSDHMELTTALEELISDKTKRERLGKNGREHVLEQFDANEIAKKIALIYGKII